MIDSVMGSSNTALFVMVAAAIGPWLVATINQSHWGANTKTAVLALVAALASAAYLVASGQFHTGDLTRLTLLVFAGATVVYKLLHKPVAEWEQVTDLNG